jgi:hypothetical protein
MADGKETRTDVNRKYRNSSKDMNAPRLAGSELKSSEFKCELFSPWPKIKDPQIDAV